MFKIQGFKVERPICSVGLFFSASSEADSRNPCNVPVQWMPHQVRHDSLESGVWSAGAKKLSPVQGVHGFAALNLKPSSALHFIVAGVVFMYTVVECGTMT